MVKPRILIIDDDQGLRKTLADILKIKEYEVLTAKDGAEGIAILKDNSVNLALIDLGLPDISGLDLLNQIKAQYPAMEAIILTGNATLDSAVEATNLGAFSYLTKPYVIDQLLLLIKRAIEKQQAGENLRAVNETLSVVFNSINDAIFIHETDGTLIDVNDKMLEMYNVERDEAIKFSIIADYSDSSNPTNKLPELWKEAESGKTSFFEWKARRPKDGSIFDAEVFLRRISLGGKNVILATVRDISSRKATERELDRNREELLEHHQKLEELFMQVQRVSIEWEKTMDSIGDMVILAGNDGSIRRCNKAVQEFTKQIYDDIIGSDWRTLLNKHGFPDCSDFVTGEELYNEESGRWFIFNSYPYSITDNHGDDISSTVITIINTTELKRSAEALSKASADLQASQLQMFQNEKMASIGQLAAGVAHEINNPMGFILSNLATLDKYAERLISFLQLQSQAVKPPLDMNKLADLEKTRKQIKLDYIIQDMPQLINESLEGADRVKKIVQDLKTFSRKDEENWKYADINECLESTLNVVWNELKYKAAIEKEYGTLPAIKCNPGQLNQVFMNLLVNAAHAIETFGTITIKSWHDKAGINVAISDTGCGVPESLRSRIFEPFFTTKDVGKGTGLGLSISYDIVKKHGGRIDMESALGRGTTFTVILPFNKDKP